MKICGKKEQVGSFVHICRRKPGHDGRCFMGRAMIRHTRKEYKTLAMLRQLDNLAHELGWAEAEKIVIKWINEHYEKE
jgi:hypothetical protein